MFANLRHFLVVLACIKLLSTAVMAFRPISPPHEWRQIDTVGVAMRYWQRWTVEGSRWPEAILPAVLNSQDSKGLVAQEFAVLNGLMAPAFILGDYAGRIGAHLIFLGLTVLLLLGNLKIWRGKTVLGLPADFMVWLLPVFGFAVPYWGRVIPDIIAGLLVFAGVGFWWPKNNASLGMRDLLCGLILIALGVLIKPPAVVGVALLLLHPYLRQNIIPMSVAGAVALVPAALYYTVGIRFLKTFEEGQPLFAVDRKPVLEAWLSVWNNGYGFWELMLEKPFNWGGLVVLPLLALICRSRPKATGLAFLVFVLAMIAALTLAGDHVFVHSYYLTSIAPICGVIFLLLWQAASLSPSWLRRFGQAVLVLIVLGSFLNYLPLDTFGWTSSDRRPAHLFRECEELKRRAADWPWKRGVVFRSSKEPYPLLGLCFGEREGSKVSPYGFFFSKEALPEGCEAAFQSKNLVLARCVS